MMSELVAIDSHLHRDLKVAPALAEQHGRDLHLIPALVAEFQQLALQHPIVLTKNGDTGQFLTVAMLGFEPGENLFWQHDSWQGLYLPLQIRRQPFFVGEDERSGQDGLVLCIDPTSPTITGNSGERLFNRDGSDSEYFLQAKQLLAQILQAEIVNEQFVDLLLALELVQPLALEIEFCNQQKQRLQGLYTINQDKLASLSAENLQHLQQQNALSAVYAMVLSLGHMMTLIDKKNHRLMAQ